MFLEDALDFDSSDYFHWACVGVGGLCFIIGVIFLFMSCCCKKGKSQRGSDSIDSILANDDEEYVPQTIVDWHLDADLQQFGKCFAHGRWGNVHHGVYNNTAVVLKRIPMPPIDKEGFYREFGYQMRLSYEFLTPHKGIVFEKYESKVEEAVSDGSIPMHYPPCELNQHDGMQAWLVTDHVPGITLHKHLHESTTTLTWKQRIALAIDIAKAMCFLHSIKPVFAHRCLASTEVYVTSNGAVLGGTEFSALKALTGTTPSASAYYQAPESIKNGMSLRASDIYSLGMLIWEIIMRTDLAKGFKTPSRSPVKLLEAICAGERLPMSPWFPPSLVDLLNRCWQSDPGQRPNAEYVLYALLDQSKHSVKIEADKVDGPLQLKKSPVELEQMMRTFVGLKKENWIFDASDVTYVKRMGVGSSGEVWEGRLKGQVVAVKKQYITQMEHYSAFLREASVLRNLRHSNIVLFMGIIAHPEHAAVITELYPRGPLLNSLSDFKYEQSLSMLIQLASALHLTHHLQPPLLHRDLRTANVLMDNDGNVRLADFSLSNYPTLQPDNFMDVGNMLYQSPEILQGAPYTLDSDIYSFGIVMWELLARKPPFSGSKMAQYQTALAIVVDDIRPVMPNYVPPDLTRLIKLCWDKDPSKRPSASRVLNELERLKEIGLPQLVLGSHNSQQYVKKHPVSAVRCNERVKVFKSWGITNSKPNDYIVSGLDGDVYTCDADIFEETYRKIEGTDMKYKKIQRIYARRCSREYLIKTSDGLEYATKGDFIAQNPLNGEQWPIRDFDEAYIPAEDQSIPSTYKTML